MSSSSVAARIFGWVLLSALLAGCRHEPRPYFAFIDKSGSVRIRLQPSQYASSFSEGLAAVSRDGRWGYIDASGAWVIPPRFAEVEEFSEGLAVVGTGEYSSKTTQFGFIDRTGKFVIAPRFDWASSFSDGLAGVCTGACRIPELAGPGRSYGYIDKTGDYVIGGKWEFAGPFSDGRAWVFETPVLVEGKVVDHNQPTERLIDRAGKFVSEARFRWGMPFSNGLAVTDRGYVNRAGEVAIAQPSPDQSFAEGWARVIEGGRSVFIDRTGKVVLRPDCLYAESFSEGLAPACRNDREYENGWGYIGKTGKFVIPPQFHHSLGPFRNGLALVCIGCKD
jgi:hypothetical protein